MLLRPHHATDLFVRGCPPYTTSTSYHACCRTYATRPAAPFGCQNANARVSVNHIPPTAPAVSGETLVLLFLILG